MGPNKGRLHLPFHEPLCRFAQIDGSRLGQGLQTRSEVHGVAQCGYLAAFVVNLGDHRQARIDANAHLGPDAMLVLDRGGGCRETLVNRQSGAACPQWSVLQRIGHAEQRHYPVAREVLDRPALLPDGTGHQFVNRLDQGKRAFLAEPLGGGCKPDHVGK